MSRLTDALDDVMNQALKEVATRQGRLIGKIIEEGLILRGIKPVSTTRDMGWLLPMRQLDILGMQHTSIPIEVDDTLRPKADPTSTLATEGAISTQSGR